MRATLTVGRVRGIDVGVHWSVLFVLALLAISLGTSRLPDDVEGYSTVEYWLAASITAVSFLASILAHELSHALVAVHRGVEVNGITLWLLGGVAELKSGAKTPGDELQIALVGPLTSLGIGIVAGAAAFGLETSDASRLEIGRAHV